MEFGEHICTLPFVGYMLGLLFIGGRTSGKAAKTIFIILFFFKSNFILKLKMEALVCSSFVAKP